MIISYLRKSPTHSSFLMRAARAWRGFHSCLLSGYNLEYLRLTKYLTSQALKLSSKGKSLKNGYLSEFKELLFLLKSLAIGSNSSMEYKETIILQKTYKIFSFILIVIYYIQAKSNSFLKICLERWVILNPVPI